MANKIISPRFTLTNWTFLNWLKGNWTTIKEMVKVGAPAILSWLATQDPIWTVVCTTLGKLVLDVLDYYLGEQKA